MMYWNQASTLYSYADCLLLKMSVLSLVTNHPLIKPFPIIKMNTAAVVFIVVVACLSAADAFSSKMPKFQVPKVAQKAFAGAAAVGALTFGVELQGPKFAEAAAGPESVFVGAYNDPNHPGCMRKITAKGTDISIVGSDNVDGSKQWLIKAKEDYPGTIFVDFSPKGT